MSFTISAWFYIRDMAAINAIYGEYESSQARNHLSIYYSDNKVKFDQYTPPGYGASTTSTVTTNKWFHIAYVQNGDSWIFYLNGVLDNSGDSEEYTGNLPTKSGIGARYIEGNWAQNFNGVLDEIRIWDTNLTQSII